ncbi:zf-TFIIB domain-containing protein [Desulfatibacillum aliphaticivorans]|uniref:zf-TFIIB domain-containing protein n=1 Tax=Desulfatibacillum aliphaticivorans TaxID=218208 RepID=UPI00041F76FD|nr:zf-TFIIB domain-containing protein [Desulfatibacillum aliphaticivorans]
MKCPACGRELTEMTAGDVKVDACQNGCGGIWFDRFELKKLADPRESDGESLLELNRDPEVSVDLEARKKCPACADMVMMRHFFSPKKAVEVEECPQCGGHWLDCGELGEIRSWKLSDKERFEATQEYFSEIFDNQLAQLEKARKVEAEKISNITRIFRFITPSWYLKRK